MKILFIAHYFQPEPNFFFGLPFAQELVRRGHEVEVLTGYPNYPQGRIYPEYRQRLHQVEVMEGIRVHRVPLYPSHCRSSVKRMLSYMSQASTQTLLTLVHRFHADVAYVCQGPTTIGLPAVFCKWLQKTPFVYQIQDLWPDSLEATGMFHSKSGAWLLHRWCNFIYRQAEVITVIAPGMKRRLMERGVPEKKIEVLYNWCDEQSVTASGAIPDSVSQLLDGNSFKVLYAGNIGKAQALDRVIDAAEILKKRGSTITLILLGDGVEKERLTAMVANRKLDNVRFCGRIPVAQVGSVLRRSDVLLTHLRNDPLFDITVPSKIQAYLAVGKPILAAVGTDATSLVEKAGAGFSCTPENPEELADTMIRFQSLSGEQLDAMGKSGKEFYEQELSFQVGVSHFEKLFFQAVRGASK